MHKFIRRGNKEYKFLESRYGYDVYEYDVPCERDCFGGIADFGCNIKLYVLLTGGELEISNDVYRQNGVTPVGIALDDWPVVCALFEEETGPIAEAIVKRLK